MYSFKLSCFSLSFSLALSLSLSLSLSHSLIHTPHTAPNETVANITAARNDNNTVLIIQWVPYFTPDGKTVATATYEIEYRVVHSNNSSSVVVNGNRTLGIISGLRNASSYEVM